MLRRGCVQYAQWQKIHRSLRVAKQTTSSARPKRAALADPQRDCQVGAIGSGNGLSSTVSDPERGLGEDTPEAVGDRRDPGVGCAHQRQAEFDRAQASLGEMLIRPGVRPNQASSVTLSMPARPIRPGGGRTLVGEDRLVADHRQRRRQTGNAKHIRSAPRVEAAGNVDELGDADPLDQIESGIYSPNGTR